MPLGTIRQMAHSGAQVSEASRGSQTPVETTGANELPDHLPEAVNYAFAGNDILLAAVEALGAEGGNAHLLRPVGGERKS